MWGALPRSPGACVGPWVALPLAGAGRFAAWAVAQTRCLMWITSQGQVSLWRAQECGERQRGSGSVSGRQERLLSKGLWALYLG